MVKVKIKSPLWIMYLLQSKKENFRTGWKNDLVAKKTASVDMFSSRSMDFTLTAPSGGQSKTIHATFADTYPLDPPPVEPSEVKGYTLMAVVPYEMKSQFERMGAPEKLNLTFWSDNPGKSAEQMKTIIDGAGVTSGYTLYNVHQLLEENRNILFIVKLFTAIFVIIMTLIAVANVFNTISTNIKLRRRELAMLRSVGQHRSQHTRRVPCHIHYNAVRCQQDKKREHHRCTSG